MMIHDSWFPVPIKVIKKYGAIDDRTNPWTRPEFFVGNGPFVFKEWRMNSHILVVKSPTYWDAQHVRLNKIYFDPSEDPDTAERMFRSGQLHTVPAVSPSKVAFYRKNKPNLINVYPILAAYFYKFNVTKPPLNDKRVREALAMAIDRRAITETIMRAGEEPAYFLTPPNCAGYTCQTKISQDVAAARRLLAEAGYPDGKNFPTIEVLFNTLQAHKAIAEAMQQMWKQNLNIDIVLHNEEWKVYLDSMRRTNYSIARAAWIGDYVDPSTFLDMFTTDSGNNETGWSNAEYDRLIHLAGNTGDRAERYAAYQKAEAILMDEMPIIPIYFYTQPRLILPCVKGWYPNLLDQSRLQIHLSRAGSQLNHVAIHRTPISGDHSGPVDHRDGHVLHDAAGAGRPLSRRETGQPGSPGAHGRVLRFGQAVVRAVSPATEASAARRFRPLLQIPQPHCQRDYCGRVSGLP